MPALTSLRTVGSGQVYFSRFASEEIRALVDKCRLSRALVLLQSGRRTVAEAAVQTGFASTGSFRRAFKRWAGVSATAARPRAPSS